MFVLGIYDGMTIPIGSFYGGYATAIGMVYCMAPNVNYILGNLGLGGWAGASSLCMLLALNRCIDMIDPKLGSKLFDGKKTYLWISIPVIYSLYYVFFHTTVVFNSNLCAFFFDPFLGVPERNGTIDNEHYPHTVHSLHNMLVVVVLLVCYVVLCIILSIKAQMSSTVKVSKMQRQTFIQSLLVCAATFIAASVYVYMQFFPTPVWIVITGELCWQMSHGAAGISYAFLNKTMRNEAKRIFCGTTRSSTVKNITESQSQLQF
uniref:Uncharacterized protein n=1 Tax=Panagrolaimus sp. JU765 TaxID=591449 RepID=A0AC34QJE8_9BILA